jgi:hypothetical protein
MVRGKTASYLSLVAEDTLPLDESKSKLRKN